MKLISVVLKRSIKKIRVIGSRIVNFYQRIWIHRSQRRNNNNHQRPINSEHFVNVSGIRVYIHLSTVVRRFMNATIGYNIFELIVISIPINNRFLFSVTKLHVRATSLESMFISNKIYFNFEITYKRIRNNFILRNWYECLYQRCIINY